MRRNALRWVGALALSVVAAWPVAAATPAVDATELVSSGFKVLVPTNSVQQQWVQQLEPGRIRPMQRNGRKFFIYPDANGKQIYVGGPVEYAAYRKLRPDTGPSADDVARRESDYRRKQSDKMEAATGRDESNPYLGLTWNDLLY